MVPRKILWLLVLLDGDDNYILFGFAVTTILLSLVTRLTIVAIGAKVQNSCILGLGLVIAQIDKY